jgi:uncharacterized protein (TIGR02453 family)
MAAPYFTRSLFDFLRDLAANNDRAWFAANRDRYEEYVRRPALRLIADFGPWVRAVSPHLVCDPRPSGGSLFRIHRDIRFSADKSPYKTHAAIQFRHEAGKDAHAPGLYLHLEPGQCGAAAGVWRPDTAALRRIRARVAAEPERWLALMGDPALASMERFGERLQRIPPGYRADQRAADELRWKDWGVWVPLAQRDVLAADALPRLGATYAAMRPMMRFLCEALDLPF